jgi:hypothetical protein
LIVHIDNLKLRSDLRLASSVPQESDTELVNPVAVGHLPNRHIHPDRIERIQTSDADCPGSDIDSVCTTETEIHNEVIDNCELFLEQSKQERKAIGCRNRQTSRVVKRKAKKEDKRKLKTFGTQTEGIDGSELR